MINVQNLTIGYFANLFEDKNFKINNGDKIGLVGPNGCGKSTLFKLLVGQMIPDSGRVVLDQETVGYLPQQFSFDEFEYVGEFLESLVPDASELWQIYKVLGLLGLSNVDEFATIKNLSPGQKMKLYLTRVLMTNPTTLLLDEPTNHLDITGIKWFESFVKKFDGACLVISHDRAFLNNIVSKIFELDEQKLIVFEGNYDSYSHLKTKCPFLM